MMDGKQELLHVNVQTGDFTCQSQEGADVTELQSVSERLDGSTDGRKNHNQVADGVPCSDRDNRDRLETPEHLCDWMM